MQEFLQDEFNDAIDGYLDDFDDLIDCKAMYITVYLVYVVTEYTLRLLGYSGKPCTVHVL